MARPSKSVKVMNKHLTKEEIDSRKEVENKLRGLADKIKPPDYLSDSQKEIFNYIVSELEASEILSNLDIYILTTCSIAIDRLKTIEIMINADPEQLENIKLMSSKDKYTKDLWRATNELSLSPQSRAKLGNLNLQDKKKKEDPLLKVINGSGKGG
jgi:P27 family predicted phage terminase small subunit